jgi:metal-sulfur cluster biosynthetic enzyme
VQSEGLDQPPHGRLGTAQDHAALGAAQAAGDHREVEDQRRVGHPQRAEVHEQVAVGAQRTRQGAATPALRGGPFLTRADEDGGLVGVLDDGRNLHKNGGYTEAMPTLEDVEDALTNVIDPELGLDFVELGLIYGVEIDGGNIHVTFTLTTPACPIGPQVSEQIEEFVSDLDGVDDVTSSMIFTPPWSPEKMSEDAKFALGY